MEDISCHHHASCETYGDHGHGHGVHLLLIFNQVKTLHHATNLNRSLPSSENSHFQNKAM